MEKEKNEVTVLCTNCHKPNPDTSHSTCPKCRQKRRAYYAYRRKNGLCVKCGRKTEKGKAYCLIHAADRRNDSANFRRSHPDYYKEGKKEYRKKLMEKRIAEGMCTTCGKRKPEPGYHTCAICKARKNRKNREKYKTKLMHPYIDRSEWPDYGFCFNCGKEPPIKGMKICQKCYEKNRASLAKARELGDNSYFRSLNNVLFTKEMK